MNDHHKHCFIALPYGRTAEEHAQLMGWVELVMCPVIDRLGLQPEVAVATAAATQITDEMREHLALDRLAFFMLGGMATDDPPNANVMYELGIRHSFDLPSIVLAQSDQHLPFDIQEHRIIRANRDFSTVKTHIEQLEQFSRAALERGEFFRPMHNVRRARLVEEVVAKTQDTALGAVIEEVLEVRKEIRSLSTHVRQVKNELGTLAAHVKIARFRDGAPLSSVPLMNATDDEPSLGTMAYWSRFREQLNDPNTMAAVVDAIAKKEKK